MNITFLTSSLSAGGAERVASTLCNAWVSSGINVTLIPTFSGYTESFYHIDSRVNLRFLYREVKKNRPGKQYIHRLQLLRRMILEAESDVVVSFLPNVNVAAILATACTGIPCLIGERSDPLAQPIGWKWSTACRLMYRFADVVTVQTTSVANGIKRAYPRINRVTVIPNPLPHDLPDISQRTPPLATSNARRILLYVGRLSSEKRVDRIIDAFAELATRHPTWDLHILGDGPLREVLLLHANSYGLSNGRVRFLGYSNQPWKVMLASDAFVMASAYEGFPNALLEAVALGLPSVSMDCPSGPREISEDGRVAMLVPNNQFAQLTVALDRLMGDPALRERLGQCGAKSVRERFTLAKVLALWDSVFINIGLSPPGTESPFAVVAHPEVKEKCTS